MILIESTNRLFSHFYFDIESFSNVIITIILILLSLSLPIGLLLMIKERKFILNNWIRISVIYYSFTYVFLGLPNLFRIDFNSLNEQFNFVETFRYWFNFSVMGLMIIFCSIYWIRYHIPELINTDKVVSSKKGLRFLNHLIDTILISLLTFDVLKILHHFNFDVDYIFVMLPFAFLYYFSLELVYRQTVGKTFTNTIVNTNSKNLLKTILIRSISRHIPFEPFSFILGDRTRWHDRLSKTHILKIK